MNLTKSELLELAYIVSKYQLEIEQLVNPYDQTRVIAAPEAMRQRERARVKTLMTKISEAITNAQN